ncbi:hypothetical protein L1889_01440 [Paenalcaligenes niemegkensis]|uniref:hypothetical protein n=1 Tax=Paenalcaligenes niemegkensis TaxID=2895469 RepID=UPI001EE78CA4|nr:hypothetical protein [Paenalcaligenes niemegkensis]MCQ9615546.1 hypothetical protein [Paenalcaligenes niemegkensis]
MNKTLSSVVAWALLGLVIGGWLGYSFGWATFALGLLLMVIVSGAQLQKIRRWVHNLDLPPPLQLVRGTKFLLPYIASSRPIVKRSPT